MNKLFLTIGVFCLVVSYLAAAPNIVKHGLDKIDDINKDLREDIETQIKASIEFLTSEIIREITALLRDPKEKCPDLEQKLKDTIDEVTECVFEIDIGANTICGALKSSINKCSKPVIAVTSECLPKESSDLPLLMEKTLVGFFDQSCHTTIEEVLELFNPCQYQPNFSKIKSCQTILNTAFEFVDKIPSTKSVCESLASAKKCSDDVHDLSCTNPISKNIFGKFHKNIEEETEPVCNQNKI